MNRFQPVMTPQAPVGLFEKAWNQAPASLGSSDTFVIASLRDDIDFATRMSGKRW